MSTRFPMLSALLRLCIVFLIISIVVFVLPSLMPGDPARIALQEQAQSASAENLRALNAAWGLDRSALARYAEFISGFFGGDWGKSLRTGRPIAEELGPRLPWSLAIGVGGLLLGALASVPLGYAAACRPSGFVDRLTRALAIIAQSLPAFVLAVVLAWLLSAHWQLVKVYTGSPLERVLLPMALVALYAVASLTRVVRHACMSASVERYMLTARGKGLSRGQALRRHAWRPVMLTLLAALTPQAAWVVGGTAIVEVAFAVPGISQLVVESVASRDHPVLRVYILGVALLMVVIQALSIVLRHWLDPRPYVCVA